MEGEQCGGMAGRDISEAESSQCFDHDAGFGSIRRLLSSKTCKLNQTDYICKVEDITLHRSLCPERMLNVADVKRLLQPGVNAAMPQLLKSQCFGVTA
jgi:hypothetical protein